MNRVAMFESRDTSQGANSPSPFWRGWFSFLGSEASYFFPGPQARCLCHLVTIFFLASFLAAKPRVEATAQPTKVTVGDLIQLTLSVHSPQPVQVEFPQPGDSLGPFEVRDMKIAAPQEKDGESVQTATYTLSIFETGEFKIPPLEVRFPGADGADAQTAASDEIPVTVESVKPADAKDILDIKPPLEMARAWWSYWPWLIPLALGVLALVLWRRRKRPSESGAAPRRAPRLSAYDEAYQALCRLRDSGLLEQGKVKLYYIEFSEIIRRYLERRFEIQAMEMTSSEIRDQLAQVDLEEGTMRLFDRFLEECDLVKFAKWAPPRQRSQATTQAGFEILEATRPTAASHRAPESAAATTRRPTAAT